MCESRYLDVIWDLSHTLDSDLNGELGWLINWVNQHLKWCIRSKCRRLFLFDPVEFVFNGTTVTLRCPVILTILLVVTTSTTQFYVLNCPYMILNQYYFVSRWKILFKTFFFYFILRIISWFTELSRHSDVIPLLRWTQLSCSNSRYLM